MKTKHYEFTEIEMLAIREALDVQWHEHLKTLKPKSAKFIIMKKATRVLLDQFKSDVFKM